MEDFSKAHAKFRTTKAWKEFRLVMIAAVGGRCQCCGIKKQSKRLQVHHIHPTNYEDLNPDKFAVLCPSCHDVVERYARRLRGKKSDEIANSAEWWALYGRFVPHYE